MKKVPKKVWVVLSASDIIDKAEATIYESKFSALRHFAREKKMLDSWAKSLEIPDYLNMPESELNEYDIYVTYNSVGSNIIAIDIKYEYEHDEWIRCAVYEETVISCDDGSSE